MQTNSIPVSPGLVTAAQAAPPAPSAPPAAQGECAPLPADEVRIMSNMLGESSEMHLITPIELRHPYPKKQVPDGSKRIDAVKDVLHMDQVHAMGITGKGVTVAVIDTGIYPHEDYQARLIGWKDMVNDRPQPYDDNGHGTHCAGLVAGDGHMAGGKFQGSAPEANLVGIKVLSGEGGGAMSDVVRGIEWAIENKERYNIRVLSMSLGAPSFQKARFDLVSQAVDKAYDAGILPVIAAGNSGPTLETIGTPGISDKALTIGAYDDKNTANLSDDTVAFFSSRGPTTRDRTLKPDMVSPGVNLVSTLSPRSGIDRENIPRYGDHYILLSGTSMATPVAAGIVACMLQANPLLTPAQTVDILKATALEVADTSPIVQGAGLINPVEAVKTAMAMKAQPASTPEQPQGA